MAKRKKGSARLPRVAVYAMNRRELAEFILAVERLSPLVERLEVSLTQVNLRKARQVMKPAAAASNSAAVAEKVGV